MVNNGSASGLERERHEKERRTRNGGRLIWENKMFNEKMVESRNKN